MDCGPASLASLLGGFHLHASYGRLREACQTDVDGTSIDTLEEIATDLGLAAEQIMIPLDHVLLPETEALPAIAVIRQPGGMTHFVVLWSARAGLVQVMDPGVGRVWAPREKLLRQLFVHQMPVPASAFEAWARSAPFTRALRARMKAIGADAEAGALLERALARPDHRGIAELDAAARMIASVVNASGLSRGRAAARALAALLEQCTEAPAEGPPVVPEGMWTARPTRPSEDGEERVLLRGAVLVSVSGIRPGSFSARRLAGRGAGARVAADRDEAALSPELRAALDSPPAQPGRELFRLLRQDGVLRPLSVLAALLLVAGATVLEALVLRGMIGLGGHLGLVEQRLAALGALVVLVVAILLLEVGVASFLQGIGRRLEIRLRLAFLTKIPRLPDRYLQSRPASDMAQRSHAVHELRTFSGVGGRLVRATLDLAMTAAGLMWLSPGSAPLVAVAVGLSLAVPLALHPLLTERDLRQRAHGGALGRFYLDALLGLAPVKAHGAERVVRREHEGLVVEWALAGRSLLRAAALAEGIQAAAGFTLAVLLFAGYVARGEPAPGSLLFVYWALNVPVIGAEIAQLARRYPGYRNRALRLLEPLGALDEPGRGGLASTDPPPRTPEAAASPGVSVRMRGVGVLVCGHTVLDRVDLDLSPGQHVAVVGPSGAGKSTLVGLLLGWYRAAAGEVLVDGERLEGAKLAAVRSETAWVDPSVQIWNRSLLENLTYGSKNTISIGRILDEADLRGVVERLPEGLQTPLGEGGGLLSGGEGQRVRLGRALSRTDARLVVLDEPFRGLDRVQRRALLGRVRARWASATMICITHDVGETADFDRVIVVEEGRIVEDAPPLELRAREGSRYRALLDAETKVREGLWSSPLWRRLQMIPGAPLDETRRGS